MPLIVINIQMDEITITGHAGYAPQGKDIVCAGISALAQSLIKSLQTLTIDKIECVLNPGHTRIKYKNLSGTAITLIDSFFVGVKMIADDYPDHVRVVQAWRT